MNIHTIHSLPQKSAAQSNLCMCMFSGSASVHARPSAAYSVHELHVDASSIVRSQWNDGGLRALLASAVSLRRPPVFGRHELAKGAFLDVGFSRGGAVRCIEGSLWITCAGRDITLVAGQQWNAAAKSRCLVEAFKDSLLEVSQQP